MKIGILILKYSLTIPFKLFCSSFLLGWICYQLMLGIPLIILWNIIEKEYKINFFELLGTYIGTGFIFIYGIWKRGFFNQIDYMIINNKGS